MTEAEFMAQLERLLAPYQWQWVKRLDHGPARAEMAEYLVTRYDLIVENNRVALSAQFNKPVYDFDFMLAQTRQTVAAIEKRRSKKNASK